MVACSPLAAFCAAGGGARRVPASKLGAAGVAGRAGSGLSDPPPVPG